MVTVNFCSRKNWSLEGEIAEHATWIYCLPVVMVLVHQSTTFSPVGGDSMTKVISSDARSVKWDPLISFVSLFTFVVWTHYTEILHEILFTCELKI